MRGRGCLKVTSAGDEGSEPAGAAAPASLEEAVYPAPGRAPHGRFRSALGLIWRVPGRYWVVLVVVGAFGPYLGGGVRTEQIVVYGLGLLLLWPVLRGWSERPRGLGLVLALWLVPAFIAAVGALRSHTAPSGYLLGTSALAGIDNYLMPVVLIALVGHWLSREPGTALLDSLGVALVGFTSANASVAILQFAGVLKGTAVFSSFWAEGADSVGARALGNARYTGVFNQPVEAGVAYTAALLVLSYLWMRRGRLAAPYYLVPLVLLVTGAFLTQSKTVLLLGIPILGLLLLLRAFHSREARRWLLLVCSAEVLVGVVLLFGFAHSWYGSRVITGWLRPLFPWVGTGSSQTEGVGFIQAVSGLRYGENGTIATSVGALWRSCGWFGFGAAGVQVPYDSAWLEVLVFSGFVGLASYVGLLGYLVVEWMRRRRNMSLALWVVSAGSVLLVIGASAGAPALTINRASTLLWLTLLLSLFAVARSPRPLARSEPAKSAEARAGCDREVEV
jgi:hypothetical protein